MERGKNELVIGSKPLNENKCPTMTSILEHEIQIAVQRTSRARTRARAKVRAKADCCTVSM